MNVLVPALALIVERGAGYPKPLLAGVGHPVIWMGALIDRLERRLNRLELGPRQRRGNGAVALGLLLGATLLAALALLAVTRSIPLGWVLEALLASTLLAQNELRRAVAAVADGLRRSLVAGREAVSQIVGRDPDALDEHGVARAAVESLAESTSDGVVAPLFWLILLGLPGIALYKAINTADSMVGHRDERYRDYGWASARLDDLANWIPARITALIISAAAFAIPAADPARAWRVARRDAMKHASPNAGWPEAAMAGALGFTLGGPRSYAGATVDLPVIGEGRADLAADDIDTALRLYARTLDTVLALTVLVAMLRLSLG